MMDAAVILGIVASIIGAVCVAFITGTVAWILKMIMESIKANEQKSAEGDESLSKEFQGRLDSARNEVRQLIDEQHGLRKDDRESMSKAIARLDQSDEARRQDARILYEKNSELMKMIYESEIRSLTQDIKDLKESRKKIDP